MNIRKLFTAMAVATAFPVASMAAVQFFDPVTGTPPTTLQGLGVYTDISAKTADTALKYFEVNAALWSDGAAKKRWIVLKPGTRITYVDTTDAFDYPEGAMFVKNFYLDSIAGDSTSRRYWETRILINKHEGGFDKWHGFTYKWRKDQSNADLVSIDNGLDTTFYYAPNGTSKPQTYKKWRFPSQNQCIECHKQGTNDLGAGVFSARGVLGFLPAQLKRPAPLQGGVNQVDWLADQGVFAKPLGTVNYAARWKGLSEPIPTGLDANQRFKVIDSMARSYIAANCSGCHSTRNYTFSGPPEALNYDWYRLTPKIEFGSYIINNLGTQEPGTIGAHWPDFDISEGSVKYKVAVQKAGMASNPFWTMTIPGMNVTPTLVTPGFAAVSPLLYRQFAKRRPAWRDSLSMYNRLSGITNPENPNPDPQNLKSWMFVNPWGSVAWRADMAAHGLKVDSLLGAQGLFAPDGSNPMPPLATNIPDTNAMRVLGEWAGNYRTLVRIPEQDSVVRVNGKPVFARTEMPTLQNRLLKVPAGWTGKAQMFSLTGRAYALPTVGRGQYAVPMSAPVGVYLFRVGDRSFRASILK